MGLYACKECGRGVSDKAVACQYCGCPTASKAVWRSLCELNTPITWVLLFIVALVIYLLINANDFFAGGEGSNLSEKLSHLGDFFGGILTPLLTFISVILLLATLKLTRDSVDISKRELMLSRQAMTESANALKDQAASLDTQNFNNMFFNLLTYHKAITASLKVGTWSTREGGFNYIDVTGVECFSIMHDGIDKCWRKARMEKSSLSDEVDVFRSAMIEFSAKYPSVLEHYIMSVESILNIVDCSKTDIEKSFYIEILKSQLTILEVVIILYVGASKDYGNESRLKQLLIKYNFFSDMNFVDGSMDATVISLYIRPSLSEAS